MQNKLVGKTTVAARQVAAKQVADVETTTKADIDVCMSGDRIESIIVTCACGQSHKIECQYDDIPNATQ